MNGGMYDELDDLVRGVGQVCVSASHLERSMAYCASVVRCKSDDWFVSALSRPGRPLKEFRALVRLIRTTFPVMRADLDDLLPRAEHLLRERHHVVHSVMTLELDPDTSHYDAWHASSDTAWDVNPAVLSDLARQITACGSEIDAFGTAWDERAPGRLARSGRGRGSARGHLSTLHLWRLVTDRDLTRPSQDRVAVAGRFHMMVGPEYFIAP